MKYIRYIALLTIAFFALGSITFWLVSYVTPCAYEKWTGCNFDQTSDTTFVNDTIHFTLNYPIARDTSIVKAIPVIHQKYTDDYARERMAHLGTFGDSAGFMNAFFSLLAFAAVIITFIYQYNREKATEKQTRKSQFENVFFNMTSTLEEIVSHLEIANNKTNATQGLYGADIVTGQNTPLPGGTQGQQQVVLMMPETISGRNVFKYIYESMAVNVDGQSVCGIKGLIEAYPDTDIQVIRDQFFDGTLDHYFRYLYRTIVYVHTSRLIEESEKSYYVSILRAQLSSFELLVLFFNCIGMDGNKFKKLIEEYTLFNNLRAENLPSQHSLYAIYQTKRYGNSNNEREGYDSSKEYAITAFKKANVVEQQSRTWVLRNIWELSWSRRIERTE